MTLAPSPATVRLISPPRFFAPPPTRTVFPEREWFVLMLAPLRVMHGVHATSWNRVEGRVLNIPAVVERSHPDCGGGEE
ncbi:hypothetical protein GCM10009799_40750 [Nocardiopsis rhodophaea]|uniref:Uncharacterized protein n=1 Tax=Nocardiopsis rhodophaea TaxID=280238 RepID=A0ABP5EYX8_9ACTN